MANRHRGEVPFVLNGKAIFLRLTLGSLADLEDAFGPDGLQALSQRLSRGSLSARDICRVLAAGMNGANMSGPEGATNADELGQRIPASAFKDAALAATLLLDVTFGEAQPARPQLPQAS